jgi:thimet oligopeptidase
MNTLMRIGFISSCVVGLCFVFLLRKSSMHALNNVCSVAEVVKLFPKSIDQIEKDTNLALEEAKKSIEAIIAIPAHERTFANTAQALDTVGTMSDIALVMGGLSTVEYLYPDAAMREKAHEKILEIQNFFIDNLSNNIDLYNAFKEYVQGNAKTEELTDEQRYFLQETMDDFERSGLNLPEEKRNEVKRVKKELAIIELSFDKNIAETKNSITVPLEALAGLDSEFIEHLKRTEDGRYILGVDYPTYTAVMENCTVADTRRDLYRAFVSRAYPANKQVLQDMIAKRTELAHLLGFPTFTHLDLSSQMVKSPERAQEFLNRLQENSIAKATQEIKDFSADLPESVKLTNGKFSAWDLAFVKDHYKKTKFNLDENEIANYFPVEPTIKGLLSIYEKFFNLEFKQSPPQALWDKEVRVVQVIDKNINQVIGFLLLDLFPRPNKYSHAAHYTIIPTINKSDGSSNCGVSVVMANFPKPTATKPALFKLDDVSTFFHEFGHALHALLGRTHMASFSGTNTKRDFVEMPSQMLEEWLWDKEILQMVSSHYQTGQPLPDELIERILKLRTFDSGLSVRGQLILANLALAAFSRGASVDLDALLQEQHKNINFYTQFDPQNHQWAAFGHLNGYGARYYGYLWSKVFALDLFNDIEKEGLLNPAVGLRYRNEVIGKGGSVDPNQLLRNFLGREPNEQAFLRLMDLV